MIRPKLPKIASGTRLTTDLVNDIINRTEYAADLLRQYRLVAGNEMYVEPHYDGTRVSYLQQAAGGATPTQPTFNGANNPNNPITIEQLLQYYGQNINGVVVPNNGIIYLKPSAAGSQTYSISISSNYPTVVLRANGTLATGGSGGTIPGAPGIDFNPVTVVVYGGGSSSEAREINVGEVTLSVDRLMSIR
jgi:sulfur carrier protein ThiS